LADQLVNGAITSEELPRDDLGRLEEHIFSAVGPETLEQLFNLKRNTLQLRPIVVPSQDVFNKLSHNEYAVTNDTDHVFDRDVYDHFIQLDTLLDDILILVGSALDAYLSAVNNRMNDIMKTLTVITAFFMPLTFITGFSGMNFFQPTTSVHTWTGIIAFVIVLTLMLLIPLFLIWWARQHAWI
jgi:magnesium transporter